MDIKMFIKEATLLLDLEASSIDEIIHDMLEAVFTEAPGHPNYPVTSPTSGTHRLFLTPNHSPRESTVEFMDNNNGNNGGGSGNTHTRFHTLTKASGSNLFASMAKMSTLNREELIEEAKKALLLEIRYNDHTCG